MRFCSHCHKWISGRPVYCPSCGRTWNYRICSRGHLNKLDSNYCSVCGSPDMSIGMRERWFSKIIGMMSGRVLRIILIVFVIICVANISEGGFELLGGFIISIGILSFGLWFASKIFSMNVKKALRKLFRICGNIYNSRGQNG